MSEIIETNGKSKLANLKGVLDSDEMKMKIQSIAPKYLKAERVVRLLLAAASRNPKIMQCSTTSILGFAMKCAETGLEPIGAGGAWPIPYKNSQNNTYELTFLPDYRGMIHCARRSDCIKSATPDVVREKDYFDYERGLTPMLKHKPALKDRGAIIAAYCILVFPDDSKDFVIMDWSEIESIRNRSNAWKTHLKYKKDCPWNTDESEMAKKTVVRRAMKQFAGLSSNLDALIEADDSYEGVVEIAPAAPIKQPREIESTVESKPEPDTESEPAAYSPEWSPTKEQKERLAELLKLTNRSKVAKQKDILEHVEADSLDNLNEEQFDEVISILDMEANELAEAAAQ